MSRIMLRWMKNLKRCHYLIISRIFITHSNKSSAIKLFYAIPDDTNGKSEAIENVAKKIKSNFKYCLKSARRYILYQLCCYEIDITINTIYRLFLEKFFM